MSQQLPTPGREPVTPKARAKFLAMLAEREAEGIATYGTSLQTENGRDVHRDLEEELIDAWQYAVQARMERERHEDLMHRIASLVDALPEVEHDSVMMVSVKAKTLRALREVVEEWRAKP